MKAPTSEQKDELIEAVLAWVKKDVEDGDITAIECLLRSCSTKGLVAYLPNREMKLWEEKLK
jgi:hypothetical protein